MKRMAAQVNELDTVTLANADQYIRICGEGFRAVSLADKSPLSGFAKTGSKKLLTIMRQFKENKATLMDDDTLLKKEERRLQSWLIREALCKKGDLVTPLNLGVVFDELLFCLDEVSLGDNSHPRTRPDELSRPKVVRCDLLAVGKYKNSTQYHPVIIELKSRRELKRLIEQCENFVYDIGSTDSICDSFLSLLKQCSGVENLSSDFIKMIVWPAPKGKRSDATDSALVEQGIIQVEYDKAENDFDISRWAFDVRGDT